MIDSGVSGPDVTGLSGNGFSTFQEGPGVGVGVELMSGWLVDGSGFVIASTSRSLLIRLSLTLCPRLVTSPGHTRVGCWTTSGSPIKSGSVAMATNASTAAFSLAAFSSAQSIAASVRLVSLATEGVVRPCCTNSWPEESTICS